MRRDYAAVDPGDAQLQTGIVEQIACLEVIGAVQREVHAVQQLFDVVRRDIGDQRLDLDQAVDVAQAFRGRRRFGHAAQHVLFLIEHLALEIVAFHIVAIRQAQVADPGTGEVVC